MPTVPTFILKKLYVVGSLRNTAEGCQLQLKNTLAPGSITGMGSIMIDGAAHSAAAVLLRRGNEQLLGSDASPSRPVAFDVNVVVTMTIPGVVLSPGQHRIGLNVMTREAGRLQWEITDTVSV